MMMISEKDLATRWDISPKTLQRWRTDKRALPYVKIEKAVRYRLDDVSEYEAQRYKAITNQVAKPAIPKPPCLATAKSAGKTCMAQVTSKDGAGSAVIQDNLISAKDAIRLTRLPEYYFRNRSVREELGVPHYLVGRQVRFKSAELQMWEAQRVFKQKEAQPVPKNAPALPKMKLNEALRRLHDGTLPI